MKVFIDFLGCNLAQFDRNCFFWLCGLESATHRDCLKCKCDPETSRLLANAAVCSRARACIGSAFPVHIFYYAFSYIKPSILYNKTSIQLVAARRIIFVICKELSTNTRTTRVCLASKIPINAVAYVNHPTSFVFIRLSQEDE